MSRIPDLIKRCSHNDPVIMGIVNATPDSFSDGGDFNTVDRAVTHAVAMVKAGAEVIDIGGESTRPNADIVPVEQEIDRVVPVIRALAGTIAHISIDTRNAETMRAALGAGATMINDVSGLTYDPKALHVVADSDVPVCIMHTQGTPQEMQKAPSYDNVTEEICAFFEERLQACARRNIESNRIILDPGIGFGKTLEHNLEILLNLHVFKRLGCPVLLGASRKSFIHKLVDTPDAKARIGGSLAAALYGLNAGVDIFRVHDVEQTTQAFAVYQAISSSGA